VPPPLPPVAIKTSRSPLSEAACVGDGAWRPRAPSREACGVKLLEELKMAANEEDDKPSTSRCPQAEYMASRFILREEARGVPSRWSDWRTPDPSPLRDDNYELPGPALVPPPPPPVAMRKERSLLKDTHQATVCIPTGFVRADDLALEAGADRPAPVPSRGSVGHPHKCNIPCKYAFKNRGCKDGADCLRCHQCEWRRSFTRKEKVQAP